MVSESSISEGKNLVNVTEWKQRKYDMRSPKCRLIVIILTADFNSHSTPTVLLNILQNAASLFRIYGGQSRPWKSDNGPTVRWLFIISYYISILF